MCVGREGVRNLATGNPSWAVAWPREQETRSAKDTTSASEASPRRAGSAANDDSSSGNGHLLSIVFMPGH